MMVQLVAGVVMVQVLVESPTVVTVYVVGVGPTEGAATVTVTEALPGVATGAAGAGSQYARVNPFHVGLVPNPVAVETR